MVTYVVLTKFTDQGIRNAKDSPKRAEKERRAAHRSGYHATIRLDLGWCKSQTGSGRQTRRKEQ